MFLKLMTMEFWKCGVFVVLAVVLVVVADLAAVLAVVVAFVFPQADFFFGSDLTKYYLPQVLLKATIHKKCILP